MALKGRRRFNADFDELKEESKRGLAIQELRVSSKSTAARRVECKANHNNRHHPSPSLLLPPLTLEFRAGDDEGSIELAIADAHGKTILTAHLLVSGASCCRIRDSALTSFDRNVGLPR